MLTPSEADSRLDSALEVLSIEENGPDANDEKTKRDKVEKAFGPISDEMVNKLTLYLKLQAAITARGVLAEGGDATTASVTMLLDIFCIGSCIGRRLTYHQEDSMPTFSEEVNTNSDQDQDTQGDGEAA